MKLELKISISFKAGRAPSDQAADEDETGNRESAVDALVERAEIHGEPEMHRDFREPPWADRARIGFTR